jgi:Cdc6-like AAA superfamily ATPase
MSNSKRGDILRKSKANLENLRLFGLSHNPFLKTVPSEHVRKEVFTDRETEMERLVSAILTSHHNILIYGSYGVGKTIFILESLRELSGERKFLPIFTTFEGSTPEDFEQCALLALVNVMRDWDAQAKEIYDVLVGGSHSTTTEGEIGLDVSTSELLPVSISGGGKRKSAHEIQRTSIQHARHHFESLLEKSKKRYDRVIIAIDEIEKRDPGSFETLLSNCRGMLDLQCSFILTGGLWATWSTRNSRSPASGAFIDDIKIKPFDSTTARDVIIAYLNSARLSDQYSDTVFPFDPDAISFIINISEGVPRVFNSICYQSLEHGRQYKLSCIDKEAILDVLKKMGQVQYGDLLRNEQHLVDVINKYGGVLSDDNVSAKRELGIISILEIYSQLEELVQKDVLQKTEDTRNIYYQLSPTIKAP